MTLLLKDPAMSPFPAGLREDWGAVRLKWLVDLVNNKATDTGRPYVGLENIEPWTSRLLDTGGDVVPEGQANLFESGDVLFGKLRPYLAKVHHAKTAGRCTSELLVLRPKKIVGEFLRYLLLAEPFISLVDSSTFGAKMPRADWKFTGHVVLPCPPVSTQRAISQFLDRRTGAIDGLIANRDAQVECLEQLLHARTTQLVTRGLRHGVPMKDAGTPWVGSLPVHWKAVRLRNLITQQVAGPYGSSLTKDMYTSSGIRVYGQQQVIPNDFSVGDYFISPEKFREMRQYEVRPNDLLVTVMGTIGKVAVVPKDIERGIINPRLVRFALRRAVVSPEFIAWVCRSDVGISQFAAMAKGTTMEGLNLRLLGDLLVPVPPVLEQEEIVGAIRALHTRVRRVTDAVRDQVTVLREYRQALITAAVTGQLDLAAHPREAA